MGEKKSFLSDEQILQLKGALISLFVVVMTIVSGIVIDFIEDAGVDVSPVATPGAPAVVDFVTSEEVDAMVEAAAYDHIQGMVEDTVHAHLGDYPSTEDVGDIVSDAVSERFLDYVDSGAGAGAGAGDISFGTSHITDLAVAENLDVTGDLVVTGALTPTSMSVATLAGTGSNTLDVVIFEHTAVTVADGATITPTHTFYSLDTAGAVTVTLAAVGTEGQLLVLINDDANACIIADTNLVSADGNAITLTNADDMVVLIYQDDKWHEIASPDGS